MNILVLGGTGAMGIPTINILASQGNCVYVTSRRNIISKDNNIKYIKGNAHDICFIKKLLEIDYDVIIDFMVYTTEEFYSRYEMFLSHTKQYVYLSSARVYAYSDSPIVEESPRLLDVIEDVEYLDTKEYALEKARQENCLMESSFSNWTIIRPYITYNNERLQLGVMEKEHWLYRALQGKTIVFSKDIAEKRTTLTYGNDVANQIVNIVGVETSLGNIYQVTTNQVVKWEQIFCTYLDTLETVLGTRPKVYMSDSADGVSRVQKNFYQVCYDRRYNRMFDSKKINEIGQSSFIYTETLKGISDCLKEFLEGERRFLKISWKLEAYFDKLTGERTSLRQIDGYKDKLKYLIFRYVIPRKRS